MNGFSKEEKFQLIKFMDEAEVLYLRYVASCNKEEVLFFRYEALCEKIEEFFNNKNPEGKDFKRVVFYSFDDHCLCVLCVSYNCSDNVYFSKVIPLFRYIEGER